MFNGLEENYLVSIYSFKVCVFSKEFNAKWKSFLTQFDRRTHDNCRTADENKLV